LFVNELRNYGAFHVLDSELQSFSMCKKRIQTQHRQECLSAVERVFGDGSGVTGDFIAINFFALVFFFFLSILMLTSLAYLSNLKKTCMINLPCVMIQEGWSLAELYQVQCVVAAPYVVPYR